MSAHGQALDRLEMARFTRRYPQLLDPLLKQMLGMVAVRLCTLLSPRHRPCTRGPAHARPMPNSVGLKHELRTSRQPRRQNLAASSAEPATGLTDVCAHLFV